MRPKTSQLWARVSSAETIFKRLLINRFYDELVDTVMAEPEDIRELALFRLEHRYWQISKEEPGFGMDEMLVTAAEIAPDLPRKVLRRLGWGKDELARLNLTQSVAWVTEIEGTTMGRKLAEMIATLSEIQLNMVRIPDREDE
jgi:hypothetical protein